MSIQFSSITADNGQQFVTVLVDGKMQPPVDNTHPNFSHIIAICTASMAGQPVDTAAFIDLFDVGATITRQFERLTERVSVKDGVITLDGDPVNGTLQDQILSFVDAGEDFGPLVDFYEKLLTNPLGDVREGLYTWLRGQGESGAVTITQDGDLLGYKSVHSAKGDEPKGKYRPSRTGEGVVNGVDVSASSFIWQEPGDVVEMPRSKVLHEPSLACGDGLHIGTWSYASGFQGDTVLLVRFSPRDIVSLPDSNASWKLRVCRYTVVEPVDEALTVPVYQLGEDEEIQEDAGIDVEFPAEVTFTVTATQPVEDDEIKFGNPDRDGEVLAVGDTIEDSYGSAGVITAFDIDGDPIYGEDDENEFAVEVRKVKSADSDGDLSEGDRVVDEVDLSEGDRVVDEDGDEGTVNADGTVDYDDEVGLGSYGRANPTDGSGIGGKFRKIHGKGGPTSQEAKGNGLNPAQDPKTGRFAAGRPGSSRNTTTGRFSR